MTVERMGIAIVTVGPVAAEMLEYLRSRLEAIYTLPIRLTGIVLPLEGWDAERGQYLGETLLGAARAVIPENAVCVLAITEADIYAPELEFIFGQGEVNGLAALVSLHRLRPEFYQQPPDRELYRRRALVECVHELGHIFGMGHCTEPGCVMRFSSTIDEADRKGPGFCATHAEQLTAALAPLSGV